MFTSCRQFDLFAFIPRPRHIAGKFTSRFGFLGTLIMLVIVLTYLSLVSLRFFTQPPRTNLAAGPTGDDKYKMVPTCIRLPNITDLSYFGYTLQSVHLDAEGAKDNVTNLTVIEKNRNEICIDESSPYAYLQSYPNPGLATIIKFKVFVCGAQDKKNPAKDVTCANFRDIVNILQYNYVTVSYQTSVGKILLNTAPKVNVSVQYFSYFSLNTTLQNPDLLRHFTSLTTHSLIHDKDTTNLQYIFNSDWPDHENLELQILFSSHSSETEENYQTSLDVVSQVGAFFGVITSVLGMVFMKKNEDWFYEVNPSWGALDENFNVENGSEAAISSEASKLLNRGQQQTSAQQMNTYTDLPA